MSQPPLGFTFAGVAAGIKKTGARDLALIVSDRPCSAAATFTRNAFPAAPVLYDRALVAENAAGLRAVAINAGCANACTGEAGLADAEAMARLAEAALGLPPRSAAVMSTGVIGPWLPMDKIAAGIQQAASELSADGWDAAAHAIMTTDTRPKTAFREVGGVRLFGVCKGAGMIHPNMATMLSVIVTDAAVEPALLAELLHEAVDVSFNCISVDGDMSTNDTVLLLANGASGWKLEAGSSKPSASTLASTLTSTSAFASAFASASALASILIHNMLTPYPIERAFHRHAPLFPQERIAVTLEAHPQKLEAVAEGSHPRLARLKP